MNARQIVTVDGLKLAWYQHNEDRQRTIVFFHGNSGSARFWQPQVESPLLADYHMIAFDLPGHGHSAGSDAPTADYVLPQTAGILLAAIDQVMAKDKKVVFVGFSYGANLVAEMLKLTDRCAGIVLVSPTILGDEYPPSNVFKSADSGIFFQCAPDPVVVEQYFRSAFSMPDAPVISKLIEDYQRVVTPFRSTLGQIAVEGKLSDEVKIMEQQQIASLIVFGEDDRMVNTGYLDQAIINRWEGKTHLIKHAGHFVSLENPAAFNDVLVRYVDSITATK